MSKKLTTSDPRDPRLAEMFRPGPVASDPTPVRTPDGRFHRQGNASMPHLTRNPLAKQADWKDSLKAIMPKDLRNVAMGAIAGGGLGAGYGLLTGRGMVNGALTGALGGGTAGWATDRLGYDPMGWLDRQNQLARIQQADPIDNYTAALRVGEEGKVLQGVGSRSTGSPVIDFISDFADPRSSPYVYGVPALNNLRTTGLALKHGLSPLVTPFGQVGKVVGKAVGAPLAYAAHAPLAALGLAEKIPYAGRVLSGILPGAQPDWIGNYMRRAVGAKSPVGRIAGVAKTVSPVIGVLNPAMTALDTHTQNAEAKRWYDKEAPKMRELLQGTGVVDPKMAEFLIERTRSGIAASKVQKDMLGDAASMLNPWTYGGNLASQAIGNINAIANGDAARYSQSVFDPKGGTLERLWNGVARPLDTSVGTWTALNEKLTAEQKAAIASKAVTPETVQEWVHLNNAEKARGDDMTRGVVEQTYEQANAPVQTQPGQKPAVAGYQALPGYDGRQRDPDWMNKVTPAGWQGAGFKDKNAYLASLRDQYGSAQMNKDQLLRELYGMRRTESTGFWDRLMGIQPDASGSDMLMNNPKYYEDAARTIGLQGIPAYEGGDWVARTRHARAVRELLEAQKAQMLASRGR